MRYAVFLSVAGEAEQAVRRLWRALADQGINDLGDRIGVPPHIALAVYKDIGPAPFVVAIENFVAQTPGFQLWLTALGVFPWQENVLFVQPKVTPELIETHARYHRLTEGLGDCHPHYLPKNWMPHCTLGMPLSDQELGRAFREIGDLETAWQPMRAELRQVSLIAFPDDLSGTPKIETVYSAALGPELPVRPSGGAP